jgi:hypothetical protein
MDKGHYVVRIREIPVSEDDIGGPAVRSHLQHARPGFCLRSRALSGARVQTKET